MLESLPASCAIRWRVLSGKVDITIKLATFAFQDVEYTGILFGDQVFDLGPTHPLLVIPADQSLPENAMVRGEIAGLATVATPIIDRRE